MKMPRRAPRGGTLKINLMPSWVKRRGWTKWVILISAIFIGIEAVVILRTDMAWSRRIRELEEEKTRLEQKKQEIQSILDEANRIRNGVKAIDDRLTMLDGILKSGRIWVEACQKIAKWIPTGVQITSLQFAGTTVTMEGFARDRKTWDSFWRIFSRSALFSSVNLIRLRLTEPFNIVLTSGDPQQGTLPGMAPPGGMPPGAPGMGGMPGMMPMEGQPTPSSPSGVSRWADYMPLGAIEFAIRATLAIQIQLPSIAPAAAPPGLAPPGAAGMPPGAPPESAPPGSAGMPPGAPPEGAPPSPPQSGPSGE